MLEFLYTGQVHDTDVTDLHPDLAVELLAAANQYSLKRLKACCEVALRQHIVNDTAAGLFQLADVHDAQDLREACLKHILLNFDKVSRIFFFVEMRKDLLHEILTKR